MSDDLQAELERLRAENERLKRSASRAAIAACPSPNLCRNARIASPAKRRRTGRPIAIVCKIPLRNSATLHLRFAAKLGKGKILRLVGA